MIDPKRFIFLLLLALLLLMTVSCSDENAQTSMLPDFTDFPAIPEISDDGQEFVKGEWQSDESGRFSYLSFRPSAGFEPFFDDGMVFFENMFIYKTATDPETGITRYGYMDPDFNKLSEPISTSPNVFQYGHAKITTEEGHYVVDSNFNVVDEVCPGFIRLGDNLMEMDWGQYVYREPFMISGMDPEEYLVPCKVEPGPANELTSPLFGYKTVKDSLDAAPNEEFIISPAYQDARVFIDGLAAVKMDGKWGFIDETGNLVFDCGYRNVRSLTHDRVACVWSEPEAPKIWDWWGIFDTGGNLLTDWRVETPDRYVNGYLAVGGQQLKRIYDIEGNEMTLDWVQHWADGPIVFHDGLALLYTTYENFYYDESFKRVFEVDAANVGARNFSDGYAAVRPRRKWGYINLQGETTIPYQYDIATDFSKGYAYVSSGVHIINKQTLECAQNPGWLIDKAANEFLKELNLINVTKFNEYGYALGYSVDLVEHTVNIHADDPNEDLEPEYVTELWEERTYYMIHIED